mmetsp:Transcript_27532/g.79326  ORF Transcript_27532/g.79326 Transcript_27532/m.79326 type:complete len:213 (+) Transcript_27532:188-826(+)
MVDLERGEPEPREARPDHPQQRACAERVQAAIDDCCRLLHLDARESADGSGQRLEGARAIWRRVAASAASRAVEEAHEGGGERRVHFVRRHRRDERGEDDHDAEVYGLVPRRTSAIDFPAKHVHLEEGPVEVGREVEEVDGVRDRGHVGHEHPGAQEPRGPAPPHGEPQDPDEERGSEKPPGSRPNAADGARGAARQGLAPVHHHLLWVDQK